MTFAATGTAATADAPVVDATATPTPAPAAPPAGDAPSAFDADGIVQRPAAEGDAPKEGDKSAEGDAPKEGDDAPTGAPDTYFDFTVPEGVALDETLTAELTTVARELNLPQDAAQKLVDLGVKQAQSFAEAANAQMLEVQQEWITSTRADAEIGGDKLIGALADAKRGLAAFGTPDLNALLAETKLNTHPEVIRAFAKIGKLVSEDTHIPSGNGRGETPPKNLADRLYPKAKKGA